MKGSQGFWNASPSAFLDWFWDCEGVEERWGEEWEEEESRDGQGKDWGELSFAFGVGSGEYEMMRGEWSGKFEEWNESRFMQPQINTQTSYGHGGWCI